jgi:hypothetical protein
MAEHVWNDAARVGFFDGEPGLHIVSLRRGRMFTC